MKECNSSKQIYSTLPAMKSLYNPSKSKKGWTSKGMDTRDEVHKIRC